MGTLTTVQLREPYLVLVGDETDVTYAKTASGLVHWRREAVAGQLRFSDDAVDLGVADMSIEDAAREGVGSLVVGVAPVGGAVPDAWWRVMIQAATAGLDVVGGLCHDFGFNLLELSHVVPISGGTTTYLPGQLTPAAVAVAPRRCK